MNAKFSQEKREDEIVTDIEIKPFAGVKKLNYKVVCGCRGRE